MAAIRIDLGEQEAAVLAELLQGVVPSGDLTDDYQRLLYQIHCKVQDGIKRWQDRGVHRQAKRRKAGMFKPKSVVQETFTEFADGMGGMLRHD